MSSDDSRMSLLDAFGWPTFIDPENANVNRVLAGFGKNTPIIWEAINRDVAWCIRRGLPIPPGLEEWTADALTKEPQEPERRSKPGPDPKNRQPRNGMIFQYIQNLIKTGTSEIDATENAAKEFSLSPSTIRSIYEGKRAEMNRMREGLFDELDKVELEDYLILRSALHKILYSPETQKK